MIEELTMGNYIMEIEKKIKNRPYLQKKRDLNNLVVSYAGHYLESLWLFSKWILNLERTLTFPFLWFLSRDYELKSL